MGGAAWQHRPRMCDDVGEYHGATVPEHHMFLPPKKKHKYPYSLPFFLTTIPLEYPTVSEDTAEPHPRTKEPAAYA